MNDIAIQHNNVYTRDGLLGPLAPFKIIDGTLALPGLSFNSQPNMGLYRPASSQMVLSIGGVAICSLSPSRVDVSTDLSVVHAGTAKAFVTSSDGGPAGVEFQSFGIAVWSAQSNPNQTFSITKNALAVVPLSISATGVLSTQGREVGYRQLPPTASQANGDATRDNCGTMLAMTGDVHLSSSYSWQAGDTFWVLNGGGSNLSIIGATYGVSLYLAGSSVPQNVVVPPSGKVMLWFASSTVCYASGGL